MAFNTISVINTCASAGVRILYNTGVSSSSCMFTSYRSMLLCYTAVQHVCIPACVCTQCHGVRVQQHTSLCVYTMSWCDARPNISSAHSAMQGYCKVQGRGVLKRAFGNARVLQGARARGAQARAGQHGEGGHEARDLRCGPHGDLQRERGLALPACLHGLQHEPRAGAGGACTQSTTQ